MPYVETDLLQPHGLSAHDQHQVYCGLDCAVTYEVHNELRRLFNREPPVYSFERALQGPYLEIMQRGFAVDTLAREMATRELADRLAFLTELLNEQASAVWDKGLNPRSPPQLKSFFYSAMQLPEIWISQKGERKLSTNRETLEKLEERYLYARPIIACILAIRDLAKQLEVFKTEIDSDGRYRTSYNIAGTETGRPSSSSNAFGTGGNAQNINQWLRYVFVADPGWKLCVIDLEQVEARDVGWFEGCLFGDWSFLDACEGGDLHTTNCRLIWPELPWTEDPKRNRAIADQQFYREFSYRDMSKRGGHLCLTPDHEVLTPEGWVPIAHKPLQIMAFSENKSGFEIVSNWIDENYSGNLHSFDGNSISALMTDNHRVPYRGDQRHGKIKMRRAFEGPGAFMPLGWGWEGGHEEVPARMIAAVMSDGSIKSTNRIEFHLRKPEKIARLETLSKMYNIPIEKRSHEKWVIHASLPKRAGAFMFNWKKECLEDFVDEYKYWDGHISDTAVALFSVDKEHIEWLQTFGRIVGIGGQIKHSVTTTNFSGTSKQYTTDYYNLGQNNRKYATGKSVSHQIIPGKQFSPVRVLCPTVASGMFYIRRKGRIFVTGNSNYMGTSWTMARSLKIPGKVADEFQYRYCKGPTCAYPAHSQYWQWIAEQLQTTNKLVTPFGRERHFFGRPGDDTTLREAIAFLPQSTTADRMNLGLWRVWRYMPQIQLLGQTYDSITFQFRETANAEQIIHEALERIRVELHDPKTGRKYVVPGEAKVGWNWGPQVTTQDQAKAQAQNPGKRPPRLNLEGLVKWKPGTIDLRQRASGFSRVMT